MFYFFSHGNHSQSNGSVCSLFILPMKNNNVLHDHAQHKYMLRKLPVNKRNKLIRYFILMK